MAAVKTQRGGPRKEPVFTPTACGSCAGALSVHKDSWRVKSIHFIGTKRQTKWGWHHRGCVK